MGPFKFQEAGEGRGRWGWPIWGKKATERILLLFVANQPKVPSKASGCFKHVVLIALSFGYPTCGVAMFNAVSFGRSKLLLCLKLLMNLSIFI